MIGDWVASLSRGSYSSEITVQRVKNLAAPVFGGVSAFSQDTLAIINTADEFWLVGHGGFFRYGDDARKPRLLLTGITPDQALEFERRFVHRSNWMIHNPA